MGFSDVHDWPAEGAHCSIGHNLEVHYPLRSSLLLIGAIIGGALPYAGQRRCALLCTKGVFFF